MTDDSIILHVVLKPNCDLENTRASLIARRVERVCGSVSCYPDRPESDLRTIPYLRDHGFFLSLPAAAPERAILAIKSSFFIENCEVVEDASSIPLYRASTDADAEPWDTSESRRPAHSIAQGNERDETLFALLAELDEVQRSLAALAASHTLDHSITDISFVHAKIASALRERIVQSRMKPFNSIAPGLRAFIEGCAEHRNVLMDVVIAENHIEIDQSALACMEEVVKRLSRMCMREVIESPDERLANGKPPRATIQLHVESDGASITCHSTHDGLPLDVKSFSGLAQTRGMLARPLEAYSEDDIGKLVLMPHVAGSDPECDRSSVMFELGEIGSMLKRAGAHGEIRNTDQGTVETSLFFPVPYVALDTVMLRIGADRFALPATQVRRFAPYSPDQVRRMDGTVRYESADGSAPILINAHDSASPLATSGTPALAILLDVDGDEGVLAADAADGYEHAVINPLPAVLTRRMSNEAGCMGTLRSPTAPSAWS